MPVQHPRNNEVKMQILRSIKEYFRNTLTDEHKHPLHLMTDGYALQIRANQNDHIEKQSRRTPGYLDVAVRPIKDCRGRLKSLELRVWTEDRGTGINQRLEQAGFADAVVKNRPGLNQGIPRRRAAYNMGHGTYAFWRDYQYYGLQLTDAQMQEMLEDYLAIETKLVELGIFQQ